MLPAFELTIYTDTALCDLLNLLTVLWPAGSCVCNPGEYEAHIKKNQPITGISTCSFKLNTG